MMQGLAASHGASARGAMISTRVLFWPGSAFDQAIATHPIAATNATHPTLFSIGGLLRVFFLCRAESARRLCLIDCKVLARGPGCCAGRHKMRDCPKRRTTPWKSSLITAFRLILPWKAGPYGLDVPAWGP